MTEVQDKNMHFYNRARKEYENNRPLNYEFSLTKEDPKSRKFRILLGRIVEVFKEGMQQNYKYDAQESNNYWQELEKHFSDTIEMRYIMNKIYEGKEVKIRLLFMLMLNNKKLFAFLNQILERIPYLYKNIEKKKANIDKELEPVDFFKDGQFTITASNTNYIEEFKIFWEEQQTKKLLFQKEIKNIMYEILDEVEKRDKKRRQAEEQIRRVQEQERLAAQQREQSEIRRKNARREKQTSQTPGLPQQTPNAYGGDKKYIIAGQSDAFNWEKKPRGMKNSQYLYIKKFKDELEVFENKGHPFHYDFKISQNKDQCAQCKKTLSKGFYVFGNDQNLCNDTGNWFCNDDMASERIQVPHKAKNKFDLRGYLVSRRSYESIRLYYDMPLIEIRHDEPVVYENKILYDFLVLKRQLHLMYDSICNTELMEKTFPKRINYFLKKNIFSLRNLYDVYNGHETNQLQKDFGILQRHFYKCDECQRSKGRFCQQCKAPPKIFSFELRDTYSCKQCRHIYHRRCLKQNVCPCEKHQTK